MKQIDAADYNTWASEIDKLMEEMTEKFTMGYFHILKFVLRSKLNARNKIEAINHMNSLTYYLWKSNNRVDRGKLNNLDRKTRMLLTIYGVFQPKIDTDSLNVPRKRGRKD